MCLVTCLVGVGSPPAEFVRRAIADRERVHSYHVILTVTSQRFGIAGETAGRVGWRWQVWSDGSRYRHDETPIPDWPARLRPQLPPTTPDGQPKALPLVRQIICRGCRSDGALVRFLSPGTAAIFSRPTPELEAEIEQDRVDPRGLGHDRIQGAKFPKPARLDRSGAHYTSAETVELNGETVTLVHATLPTGSRYRCWFNPSKGGSVIRVALTGRPDGAGAEQPGLLIENEPVLDGPSGLWFPKRTRSRRYVDGQLAEDVWVEVEAAELNRPPDPAAFTLAGLNLPLGTVVSDAVSGVSKVWDGDKLATGYRGPLPPEVRELGTRLPASAAADILGRSANTPRPADPTVTPVWIYLTAAALAVAGCGLLVRARRTRR